MVCSAFLASSSKRPVPPSSLDDSRLSRPGRARFGKPFGALFLGFGDDGGPAGGPGGRGFHGPRVLLPLAAGAVWRWSGGLRQGGDAVPGGHDVSGPGPAGLDVEAALAGAAGQLGGGVQDAVAQVLGSALARVPSRASSLSQAS